MTCGRLLFPYIRRVTVRAIARFLVLLKFVFDRPHLWISRFLVVPVTGSADRDRNVGNQSRQRASPRDIDVTGRALLYVLSLATLVTEHC